ncbi:hypothetical protein A2U01_0083378 [Trifolium medium]|uniref:Uncharacterized protein n=1 Tax=Trifolium medium TaxID=97028 RepID=A0A392TLT6_9FABA|nr:hypothetical protein [Trifolium medium]
MVEAKSQRGGQRRSTGGRHGGSRRRTAVHGGAPVTGTAEGGGAPALTGGSGVDHHHLF